LHQTLHAPHPLPSIDRHRIHDLECDLHRERHPRFGDDAGLSRHLVMPSEALRQQLRTQQLSTTHLARGRHAAIPAAGAHPRSERMAELSDDDDNESDVEVVCDVGGRPVEVASSIADSDSHATYGVPMYLEELATHQCYDTSMARLSWLLRPPTEEDRYLRLPHLYPENGLPRPSEELHPQELTPPVLITACSYESVAGLVRVLKDVPREADAIELAFPPYLTTRLDNPSYETLARNLAYRTVWFFLGHGDAIVRGEMMPLFVGDNGLCENGLQAISADLIITTLNSEGSNVRVVVLNGCKTIMLGREILARCPHVNFVVCWQTASHSSAADVFGATIAHYLAENDGESRAVHRAFDSAKSAVLRQLEPGRLANGVPVGVPRYALMDPGCERTIQHLCPCQPACRSQRRCPFVGRLKQGRSHRTLPPIAAGVPCLLCHAAPE